MSQPCPDNYERVVNDLAGTSEVAQELGVTQKNVQRWVERRLSTNCPHPVKTLTIGALYSLTEWRVWFRLWASTRGRYQDKTEEAPE